MKAHLLFLIFAWSSVAATQTDSTYTIPFATKDNTIELAVANTSSVTVNQAVVTVEAVPNWVTFAARSQTITGLQGSTDKSATFTFSVSKTAPVEKEERIVFKISANNQQWTKEIKVRVGAPEKFELYRNFPNPFNPSTTIAYQLPVESKVTLKVYDIRGREVSTPIKNETRSAGYYEQKIDASHFASGMYIYRLVWIDAQGKTQTSSKSMMLVK